MKEKPPIFEGLAEQKEEVAFAERIISALQNGLEIGSHEQVVDALHDLGVKIHTEIKFSGQPNAQFDEDQQKYVLGITSQSRGARIFINTKSYDQFPRQLIFPTDTPGGHKIESEVFQKIFAGRVENEGTDKEPYWVVSLGLEVSDE